MNTGLLPAVNFPARVIADLDIFFVSVPLEFAFPKRWDGIARGSRIKLKQRALLAAGNSDEYLHA